MKDNEAARDRSKRLWSEKPKGHDHLHKMTEQNTDSMQETGKMVKVPAERIRKRLCFVVIIETGQLSPAAVMTQLDQACA